MKESSPRISIVIPIYNTGVLLRDSLNSILEQSFSDTEILCVDDGSNDEETKIILKEYEGFDNRIKILSHVNNRGAGEARNTGLKIAKGEYILFFDSDDYANKDMLQKMYDMCEGYKLDFCTCCSYTVDVSNKGYVSSLFYKEKIGVTDRVFSVYDLGEEAISCWDTAPWNKLIRLDFIRNNDIFFQNISSCNDVYFTVMCAMKAKRIMYCENGNPLVEYRVGRKNQISLNRKPSNLKLAFELLLTKLNNIGLVERRMLTSELLYLARGELASLSNDTDKRVLYEYVQEYLKNEIDIECIESEVLKLYCKKFIELHYESRWFEEPNVAKVNVETIFEEVDLDKPIIIWGYGKNGTMIDECLRKRNLNIFVTDRKNIAVGKKTCWGSRIINTEAAIDMDATIVASNGEIYNYLKQRAMAENVKCKVIKGY